MKNRTAFGFMVYGSLLIVCGVWIVLDYADVMTSEIRNIFRVAVFWGIVINSGHMLLKDE